jgi:arylsulfatase A-like enzyme
MQTSRKGTHILQITAPNYAWFLWRLLFFCFGALSVYTYVLRNALASLYPATGIQWTALVSALVLALLAEVLDAYRWQMVLRSAQVGLPVGRLLMYTLGAEVFRGLPFGSLWRDVFRYIVIFKQVGRAPRTVFTFLLEKMADLACPALLGLSVFLYVYGVGYPPAKLRVAVGCIAACFLLVVSCIGFLQPWRLYGIAASLPLPERGARALAALRREFLQGSPSLLTWLALLGLHLVKSLLRACALLLGIWAFRPYLEILPLVKALPFLMHPALSQFLVSSEDVLYPLLERIFGVGSHAPSLLLSNLKDLLFSAAPLLVGMAIWAFLPSNSLRRIEICDALQVAHASPSIEYFRAGWGSVLRATVVNACVIGWLLGIGEAAWLQYMVFALDSLRQPWYWAPTAYALGLTPAGVFVVVILWALCAFSQTTLSSRTVSALALAGLGSTVLLLTARFRIARDLLQDQPLPFVWLVFLVTAAGFAAVIFFAAARHIAAGAQRRFGCTLASTVALVILWFISAWTLRHRLHESPHPSTEALHLTRTKPPIVLIVVDTLRADALPVYNGNAPVRTPNLDKLAQDSVVFRTACAQAPWTKPAFASLFTGLIPSHHGAVAKGSALDPNVRTLAQHLQEAGYYTQGWANNRNIAAYWGFSRGFHAYEELPPFLYFGADTDSEFLVGYQLLRRVIERLTYPYIRLRHFYRPAEDVVNTLRRWLASVRVCEDAEGKGLFVFLHFMDPHDPYRDPQRPGAYYAYELIGRHPDPAVWQPLLRNAYYAEVEHFDQYLGELVGLLKEKGVYEDALLILTADHGEEFYDHYGWCHGDTLFEEVLRVPLLIKLPHGKGAGTINPFLARQTDLLPTVLHILARDIPQGLDGSPLLTENGEALNTDTQTSPAETDFLDTRAQSVRSMTHKYIYTERTRRSHIPTQALFDLRQDPGEHTNVWGIQKEAGQALVGNLEEIFRKR